MEFHRRSVALSPETWASLTKIAKEEGITTSELVRRVLILFLGDRDRPQFNAQRMAIICEYMQLVADEWVKTHAPDRRDEFLSVVDQRLERHHGRGHRNHCTVKHDKKEHFRKMAMARY